MVSKEVWVELLMLIHLLCLKGIKVTYTSLVKLRQLKRRGSDIYLGRRQHGKMTCVHHLGQSEQDG